MRSSTPGVRRLLAMVLVFTVAPGSSLASDELDVYGRINVTLQNSDEADVEQVELQSNSSRVGVKGEKALSTSLKAIYQLEWGVNIDSEANFKGQIFSNPAAGTLGGLQRRLFDGPWTFNLDLRIKKVIHISEQKSIDLRMDAINALNHATFWSGDQNINSTTFGVVSSTFFVPRLVEFAVHYSF